MSKFFPKTKEVENQSEALDIPEVQEFHLRDASNAISKPTPKVRKPRKKRSITFYSYFGHRFMFVSQSASSVGVLWVNPLTNQPEHKVTVHTKNAQSAARLLCKILKAEGKLDSMATK